MVDYDLSKIVETAALMQFVQERRTKLLELKEATQELDSSLANGDARKEVLATVTEAGIPEQYARQALERLYPNAEKLQQLEQHFNVVYDPKTGADVNYSQKMRRIRAFISDLSLNLELQFPNLEMGILEPSSWDMTVKKYGDIKNSSCIKITSENLPRLYFQEWFYYEKYIGSCICFSIYQPRQTKGFFGRTKIKKKILSHLFMEYDLLKVSVKLKTPELLEVIGTTLEKHPEIRYKIEKAYF